MSKSKFIEDQDRSDYIKRLREFMQTVNPKQAEAVLEKLRQQYLAARSGGVTDGLDESNH